MSKERIWLSPPHMGGSELRYVQEAFESNWIAPLGPQLDAFEIELAKYVDQPYAAGLCSGTAALHLALKILGVGVGDEVLVSSFTFVASAAPITYLGAEPVFVDSETKSWNMCPDRLLEAIEDGISRGRKPKAIVLVDLYGVPCDYDRLLPICERYDIPVVEDAAEGLGSSLHGKKLGSFGHAGVVSFNGNKIITTSGGGALVSEDSGLIEQASFLATQARDPAPHYEHSVIGFNYRLSNVLAAIGRGQLEVLDEHVRARRANFDWYRKNLAELPGVSFPEEPEGAYVNRWLTTILIDVEESGGVTPEIIRLRLAEDNIEARPLWKPLHLQPAFQPAQRFGGEVAERLFSQGLCLPSGSALSEGERLRIAELVSDCFS